MLNERKGQGQWRATFIFRLLLSKFLPLSTFAVLHTTVCHVNITSLPLFFNAQAASQAFVCDHNTTHLPICMVASHAENNFLFQIQQLSH